MARDNAGTNKSSFALISIAGAFAVLLLLLHTSSLLDDDVEGTLSTPDDGLSRRDHLFSQQLEKYAAKHGQAVSTSGSGAPKSGSSHKATGKLYKGPSAAQYGDFKKEFDRLLADPLAWDSTLWDSNHNMSVTRQFEFRDAINGLGQKYVTELSVPSAEDIKPCKRTVVSFATVPKRFPYLEGLIRSFKWQNWQPDAILVAVPPFAPRMREKYEVPEFIAKDPAITLVELPVDFGPISKIAAAILHEKDPETCIFTVDDDNQPREFHFQKLVTWGAVFPTSVIAESGWNASCIYSKMPYVCPSGYDAYLFVRQDYDFMCQHTSMPLYGFPHCISPVDQTTPRGVEVVMGVSNPLYRRKFFGDDFLDIAKLVARKKVEEMLASDEAARKGTGDAAKQAPDDVVEMGKKALAHPDLQISEGMKRFEKVPPPVQLFTVDDVYISAYLANRGVPAMVVPSTNEGRPPIDELTKPRKEWPPAPLAPQIPHTQGLDTINALHGEAMFNEANYMAVRYFDMLRWWNYKRLDSVEAE